MRRVRHCHKVCSLFGTVSALHYYTLYLQLCFLICVHTVIVMHGESDTMQYTYFTSMHGYSPMHTAHCTILYHSYTLRAAPRHVIKKRHNLPCCNETRVSFSAF